MSCLIVASNESQYLQSEVQELIVCLQKANYTVNLLHTGITSLELYRALSTFPEKQIRLLWVAGHADPRGFMFNDVLITPREFGLFLQQGKVRDAVFNTCFSMDHVNIIQRHANVNIVATINPQIEDKEAWTNAIYLSKKLIDSNSLSEAYRAVLSDGTSGYRWFPAPKVERPEMYNDEEENELKEIKETVQRLEAITSRLVRALQGDSFFHQRGLIEVVAEIEKRLIKVEEDHKTENKLVLRRFDVIMVIVAFLLLVGGIIYLTYILGGYNFNAITELHLNPFDPGIGTTTVYELSRIP